MKELGLSSASLERRKQVTKQVLKEMESEEKNQQGGAKTTFLFVKT